MFCSTISAWSGIMAFTCSTIIFFMSSFDMFRVVVDFTLLPSGAERKYIFFTLRPLSSFDSSIVPVLMVFPLSENGPGELATCATTASSVILLVIWFFSMSVGSTPAASGISSTSAFISSSTIFVDCSLTSSKFLMPVILPSTSAVNTVFTPFRPPCMSCKIFPVRSFASLSIFSSTVSMTYPSLFASAM